MKNCMFSIIFQNCSCVTGRIFILHHLPVIWQLYRSSNVAIPCKKAELWNVWKAGDFLNQTYMNERHFNRSPSACPLIFSVDWSCEKSCLWKYVPKINLQYRDIMATEQGIEKIQIVSHSTHSIFFLSFVYLKILIFLVILTYIKKKKSYSIIVFFFCSVSLNICNIYCIFV